MALVAGCFCRVIDFLPLSPLPALAERSSPVGKGETFSFLMQGATAPCIPGVEPMVCHKTERKRFPASDAARVQSPGTCSARSVSAAGGLMAGMQGAKPLAQNNLGLPLPLRGRGQGDGGNKPMMRQVQPATSRASRPPGTGTAGAVRAAGGSVQGCRGRSPRRNKLWGSPFPPGRGSGGWGQKSRLMVGAVSAAGGLMAGMQGAKPLAQNNLGLPLPLRGRGQGDGGNKPMMRQVQPATSRASRPPGTGTAGAVRAAGGSVQGCRGRSPRRNKLWGSPFPPGRGVGGMGAINL